MKQLDIQFDDGRTGFAPGELISVTIQWDLPAQPDAIELRTVWNTVGKGTTDIGVEQTLTIDSPNASDSRRVEFQLPYAPYSFSSKLISVVWALELVAIPSNASYRTEIVLAPDGSEVVLHRKTGAGAAGSNN